MGNACLKILYHKIGAGRKEIPKKEKEKKKKKKEKRSQRAFCAPTAYIALSLLVGFKEARHVFHRRTQLARLRQHHDAEMIRLGIVKPAARHDEDVGRMQKIAGKLAVVGDLELLHIQLGEDVIFRLFFLFLLLFAL